MGIFQEESTTHAKALSRESPWCVGGTAETIVLVGEIQGGAAGDELRGHGAPDWGGPL